MNHQPRGDTIGYSLTPSCKLITCPAQQVMKNQTDIKSNAKNASVATDRATAALAEQAEHGKQLEGTHMLCRPGGQPPLVRMPI